MNTTPNEFAPITTDASVLLQALPGAVIAIVMINVDFARSARDDPTSGVVCRYGQFEPSMNATTN